jgi:hypothetical protein
VVLDGTKTWISNGGIADYYCVFAKTDPGAGHARHHRVHRGCRQPGLDDSEHIAVMAPHPLATLRFTQGCRIPASAQLGSAMAASSWRCRRWTSSARRWPAPRWAWRAAPCTKRCPRTQRPMFGQRLADFPADPGQAGRNGRAGRRRSLADLPRGLAARLCRHRHAGAGAGLHRAGGDGQDDGHRERAARDRHGAADARRSGRARWAPRWRACTATSARCASTRAPPRCSSSSSANRY